MKTFDYNFNKETTLCFTGHRSQKLPWKFNEQDPRCLKMKHTLYKELECAITDGYNTFLTGMALGFDMIAAEMLIDLKKTHKDICIIGAIPCRTQYIKWPTSEKKRYQSILAQLDGVRCLYETYPGPQCMLERNQFMVDNSSRMIALFNGQLGGTKDTIGYAKKKNLDVIIIEP